MSAPNPEVSHWLVAARAGSSEALGQALEACWRYLLAIADEELDPEMRAKMGASDLVQQTFLEAHQAFAQFHGSSEEELLAWLRCLLRHNLADFNRNYRGTQKRQVGREVPMAKDTPSGERDVGLTTDTPSPSGHAVAHEQALALEAALARLPDDYRRVITMRHQEQRSFEEIGTLMDRTPDAARKLWARAVEKLKKELEAPQ